MFKIDTTKFGAPWVPAGHVDINWAVDQPAIAVTLDVEGTGRPRGAGPNQAEARG